MIIKSKCLLILILTASAWGALTERYVTATQTGSGHTGTNDGADAYTWAEMVAAINGGADDGYRYNVKYHASGYSLGSTTTLTGDGTIAAPLYIEGYVTTPGDLRAQGNNANGTLNTTNFPAITYSGNYLLDAGGSNYLRLRSLTITGASTGSAQLIIYGVGSSAINVKLTCTGNNASVRGIWGGHVRNCEVQMTGAASYGGIVLAGNCLATGCRVLPPTSASAFGIVSAAYSDMISRCTVSGCASGIVFATATTSNAPPKVLGCTVYNCSVAGINLYGTGSGAAWTNPLIVENNIITDCAIGVKNCTVTVAVIEGGHNYLRNNTTNYSNFGDWVASDLLPGDTQGAGAAAVDFLNAAGGDFRLLSTSAARGKSMLGEDCGALQIAAPTLPATDNVWHTQTYGYYNELLGDKWADDIPNCTPLNIRSGTLIDNVEGILDLPVESDVKSGITYDNLSKTGTYDPMASAIFPLTFDVWVDTGSYGPTGIEYVPSKNASSITNCTPENIRKDILIGDVLGAYAGSTGLKGFLFGDKTGGK